MLRMVMMKAATRDFRMINRRLRIVVRLAVGTMNAVGGVVASRLPALDRLAPTTLQIMAVENMAMVVLMLLAVCVLRGMDAMGCRRKRR